MGKRYIIITVLVFMCCGMAAQNRIINGTVRDKNGNPMVGVKLKSHPRGDETYTDEKGRYSLSVSPENKRVRVFYDDDLVAWGRISHKKDIMDFSIDTTRHEEQIKGNTYYPTIDDYTFSKMIDGRFSGCSYSGGYVIIRGQVCMYYTVDGVRVMSLDVVNPYDVYSITIIKDMADCVIYGRDARNGAVLVTLKNGINNKDTDKSQKPGLHLMMSTGGAK